MEPKRNIHSLYHFGEKLGENRFIQVYVATELEEFRKVAIKKSIK